MTTIWECTAIEKDGDATIATLTPINKYASSIRIRSEGPVPMVKEFVLSQKYQFDFELYLVKQ